MGTNKNIPRALGAKPKELGLDLIVVGSASEEATALIYRAKALFTADKCLDLSRRAVEKSRTTHIDYHSALLSILEPELKSPNTERLKHKLIQGCLEELRNKGGCHHTEHKANQVLGKLRYFITPQDYHSLSTAHAHFSTCGEGASELYELIKQIKSKY